jgi:general L-amino acid transport system permease protein
MSATLDPRLHPTRAAPVRKLRLSWSDPRLRNIVWQIVVVGIVAGLLAVLIGNTNRNLAARHIATGFGFLGRTAGIPIGEAMIPYTAGSSTFLLALIEGLLNTIRVAVCGIVLATILGTLIGVARLSANWLVSRLAGAYIEFFRDTPLLLQLLFWYALLQGLPGPKQAIRIAGISLSNRGSRLPVLAWQPGYGYVLLAFAVAVILSFAWNRRAARRQEATGQRPPVLPVVLGFLIGLPLLAWLVIGAPLQVDAPVLRGFNFQGGLLISPEFGALLIGLVIYTAAYIAEIVRSGILAVPKGQWEAAGAIGMHRGRVLRLVVLPQALRVIIPPLTSEYLNLTKNSSLAVAIGFQDIVSIANTTLNQTGQAIEGIAIIMVVYLSISLSISAFMGWYERHSALVTR